MVGDMLMQNKGEAKRKENRKRIQEGRDEEKFGLAHNFKFISVR
jgi:hypothetical protein